MSRITQTSERGSPSWTAGGLSVAAVLLIAALFLAHGLQCAAASDHGPAAMSHTLVAPIANDDSSSVGNTGHESALTVLVAALAYPVATVGGRDVLGPAGLVCIAVLTAMGLLLLLERKSIRSGRGARLWPAGGPTVQLRAAARWRPPPLGLAVLCVLRT